MSEQVAPEPGKSALHTRRYGSAVVILILLGIVGAVVYFASSASGGAPAPHGQPSSPGVSAPVETSAPTAPSVPSPTATVAQLETADEALKRELGLGYELRDDRGNIVSLCEATRFVAAYSPYVGAPQPGSSFTLRTTEGPIDITPYSNDVNGYRGVISASC